MGFTNGYDTGFDDGFSEGKSAGLRECRAEAVAEARDFNPVIRVSWRLGQDGQIIESVKVWSEDERVAKFSYTYTSSLKTMTGAGPNKFFESGSRDFILDRPAGKLNTLLLFVTAHSVEGFRSPLFIARMYHGSTSNDMFGSIEED